MKQQPGNENICLFEALRCCGDPVFSRVQAGVYRRYRCRTSIIQNSSCRCQCRACVSCSFEFARASKSRVWRKTERQAAPLLFFFSPTKSLPILSSAYAAAAATATRTLTAPLTASLNATDAALLLSLAVMPVLVRFSLITASRCYCSSMTD